MSEGFDRQFKRVNQRYKTHGKRTGSPNGSTRDGEDSFPVCPIAWKTVLPFRKDGMTPERRRSRSGFIFCARYHVEHGVYRRRICRREALEIRPAVHSARSSRKLKSSKGIKWSRWRGRSRRAFQNHSWVEIETDLYGLSGRSTDRGNDRGKGKSKKAGI